MDDYKRIRKLAFNKALGQTAGSIASILVIFAVVGAIEKVSSLPKKKKEKRENSNDM